jgi:DNA-binding NtrC family response regulator
MNDHPSRLLIVDDDPGVLAVIRRAVELMGHAVVAARSRAEARECLRGEAFDAVITDVSMESADAGVLLVADTLALRPGTPVIFVSGRPDMEAALPVLGAGVCDYLNKPFRVDELACALNRAIGSRDEERAKRPSPGRR